MLKGGKPTLRSDKNPNRLRQEEDIAALERRIQKKKIAAEAAKEVITKRRENVKDYRKRARYYEPIESMPTESMPIESMPRKSTTPLRYASPLRDASSKRSVSSPRRVAYIRVSPSPKRNLVRKSPRKLSRTPRKSPRKLSGEPRDARLRTCEIALASANAQLGIVGVVDEEYCINFSASGKDPSCDNFIASLSDEKFDKFIVKVPERNRDILRLVRLFKKPRQFFISERGNFNSNVLGAIQTINKRKRAHGKPEESEKFFDFYVSEFARKAQLAPGLRKNQVEEVVLKKSPLKAVGKLKKGNALLESLFAKRA